MSLSKASNVIDAFNQHRINYSRKNLFYLEINKMLMFHPLMPLWVKLFSKRVRTWSLVLSGIIYCNSRSRHSVFYGEGPERINGNCDLPIFVWENGISCTGTQQKTNRKYQALRRWDLCRFSKNLGWEMGIGSPVQDRAHVSML